MITTIRKQLKGSAYKTLLWILMACFVLGSLSLPIFFRKATSSQAWAARVNGEVISNRDHRHKAIEIQNQIHKIRAQYGEYGDQLLAYMGLKNDPSAAALDALIKQALINQAAHKAGIYLHPDYIAQKCIVENQELVRMHLKQIGMSAAEFERNIERQLANSMVMDLVSAAEYVPDFAVKQYYVGQKLKKKLSIMTLALDSFLKKEQAGSLSNEEIQKFFDEQNMQSKRYMIPQKRSGIAWKFDAQSYDVEISDKKIENYYEKNKAEKFVETPAQIQIRRILFVVNDTQNKEVATQKAQEIYAKLITNPDSFAAVAQQESQDAATNKSGGLMPFFAKGEQDGALERAAFLLSDPGAISPVVQTSKGMEIAQLVEKKPKKFKELKTVMPEIKQALIEQAFEQQFTHDVKQLRIDKNMTLADFAQKKGAHKTVITNEAQDNTQTMHMLFTLTQPDNAYNFNYYVDDKSGTVVQLTNIAQSYMPLLKDVEKKVSADLYASRAAQALKNAFEKASLQAKAESLEQIKDEFGGQLEHTDWISLSEEKMPSVITDKGIPVSVLASLDMPGEVVAYASGDKDLLIRLDEIEAFDTAAFIGEQKGLYEQLQQEYSYELNEGFVASLHRTATIETDELILKSQE